ncbi:MAG: Smr/MutS family protein, partial [Acidobacteriota bacterium]
IHLDSTSIERYPQYPMPDGGDRTEYLRRLKEQFDENLQNLAALEEERAAVAAKYARLENDFAKRDREREREFREELRKVVDDFTVRAERLTAQIEDAAEQRRLKREVERRTVELKTQASTVAREMHQKYVAPAADETTPVAAEPVGEPLPPPRELRVGDRVRLLALDREGLVESVGQHEVVVQVGALRFREKPADLLLLNPNVPTAREQKLSVGLPKGVSVSLNESKSVPGSELNVIGQTVDAAVHAADKFLDAAWLDNYDRLRIVHGVGMGALKRAIADLLASHPHVSKFYPADPGEGGQGATIVELKK